MYKILVFGMTENPGGVESVIMNYYHYMDKNTFHFDFLCNSYNKIAFEEEIISNGSQTFHFPARSKNYKKYKKELKNFFENNASKYDAIWVNVCSLANIDYLKMAKKYGIKRRIIHSHNSQNMDSRLNHSMIDAIVVVCIKDWIPYLNKLLYKFRIEKVKSVVPGGETGQLSIYNGLKSAKQIAKDEKSIVLIHDGVRPLINEKVISDNIQSVIKYGSAITTAKVKETILVVNEGTATIDYVPSRNNSRVAKAPQSFWLDDILKAHEKALSEGEKNCIDSCTMMQRYGYDLYLIDGPGENIKITTPEDFYTMRAILEAKENEQIYGLE